MDIALLDMQSQRYRRELEKKKQALAPTEFGWYPYGTLNNFHLLSQLLTGDNRDFLSRVGDGLIVDIGAADGDLAFFLESLGYRAHIADFAPTNFNGCRGMRLLKQAFNSGVEILETDLDSQFKLPAERYELAFFLGILYHLKNPYLALESLARQARYAFISTRVTRFNVAAGAEGPQVNSSRIELRDAPVAYLVDANETNNDATNFWMFSEAGLRRILQRSGWDILDFMTVGNTKDSDPATAQGDERAFCYVRSRHA
ncbi:MAG TPA: methyltransferase domain-containing protein [Rhodanobacteraceae bacterium]|nr:methyltransferase domain-containing protein [Rhodanobacteraceae bacterium]